MARHPLRGIGRVRKMLRRLPDTVNAEIVVEISVTGRQMLAAVLARTPRKSGALQGGESFKVLPKSLRLQVGLLGTKRGRSKLFYGRIQDLGRKAQIVTVQRRRRVETTLSTGQRISQLRTKGGKKLSADIVSTYRMKVPAMEGKRFITGRYPDLRRILNQNLRGIFSRALSSAASRAGDE